MYWLLRFFLFRFDPEWVHTFCLRCLCWIPSMLFKPLKNTSPIEVFGLRFPHHIGLAAGLDKNAEYLDGLAKLGFAFIEVGTVTPRAQYGNAKPRLFRLVKAQALINRMGFNNHGVDVLVTNIQRSKYQGILGVNIGKNKETPLEHALDDYVYCLERIYTYADYVTINISSPNTTDLRQLQQAEYFCGLIHGIHVARERLTTRHGIRVPILIKISPDEPFDVLQEMVAVMIEYGIDGVIATNTTSDRELVKNLLYGDEVGGLSGVPLRQRSTAVLARLKALAGDRLVLIGVGGIDRPAVVEEKMQAGADLVQIYTGLIYQGPGLLAKLLGRPK